MKEDKKTKCCFAAIFKKLGHPVSDKIVFGVIFIEILVVVAASAWVSLLKSRVEREIVSKKVGLVTVKFAPMTGVLSRGETFPVSVTLTNTGETAKEINAAGVDISFDSGAINISNIKCDGQSFLGTARSYSKDDKLFLSCFRQGGSDPLSLEPGQAISLGNFDINLKSGVSLQEVSLAFSRTLVPQVKTLLNLADEGTQAKYSIR